MRVIMLVPPHCEQYMLKETKMAGGSDPDGDFSSSKLGTLE